MKLHNVTFSTSLRSSLIRMGLVMIIMVSIISIADAKTTDLTIFDGKNVPAIICNQDADTPIKKAAALLANDLTQLTGYTPFIGSEPENTKANGIIIGLASAPDIAAILKKNGISSDPIEGKWETYGRAVIPAPWNSKKKALIIFGSDIRGTIWGVIDLTREMGVSPWEWWADVKIRKTDHIAVDAGLYYSKEPSVKYRGFFLNTGGLQHWAKMTFAPEEGGIGPKTYARVFELMWRLKSNMIWPAMSGGDRVFNELEANYELAKDYAIVRGSSHVEMLLRNNSHEWDPEVRGPYNWLVNRQNMIDYWREIVEQYGKYENIYTVGLRGADDFPMQGVDTPEAMADVVNDVITEQRKILSEVLHKPADQIPQVFTPYKEITPAYNTGRINLPADIILNWSEDNFGYVMQLNNIEERKRSGGAGIYYHATFWGRPAAYLWLGSTSPSLMWEEMSKAYHFNARSLWVLNVGSIKPVEFLNEFFLALAFDIDAFKESSSVEKYLCDWGRLNFGEKYGDEIGRIMTKYYKLAFDKNPEMAAFSTTFPLTSVHLGQFSITDFGDENARRADEYKSIMAEVDTLMELLPEDRKSAFYELVQYTVDGGGNLSLRQLALDKSIVYGLQHRASANVYSEQAKQVQEKIYVDTRRYNRDIENGKWNGMVSEFAHSLPNYEYPYLPEWKAPDDASKFAVQVEGGGYFDSFGWWMPTLPTFIRNLGDKSYYFDIFTSVPIDEEWSAEPDSSWIKLDKCSGQFSTATQTYEQRINVSIDWEKAPDHGEGIIKLNSSERKQPLEVHVRIEPPVNDKNVSFVNAQGVVSMYATHADELSGNWHLLPGVGHTDADLQADMDLPPVNPDDPAALAKAPKAVFRFATTPPDRDYSFPNYIFDTVATIRAFALPIFPITKQQKLRIAISLDNEKPVVLDYDVEYFAATWRQGVLDNAAVVEIRNVAISPGSHTLTVYALDPGITFDRFEVKFNGASDSYLPVPETRIKK